MTYNVNLKITWLEIQKVEWRGTYARERQWKWVEKSLMYGRKKNFENIKYYQLQIPNCSPFKH